MPPTELDAQEIVAAVAALAVGTGRRPRVAELARALGGSPLSFRRRWRPTGRPRLRELVTYGCLQAAARLIAGGMKIEAAMRLTGFHNWTNFNRQFREFFGEMPGRYRATLPPLARKEGRKEGRKRREAPKGVRERST